jgi:uncharacterized protein YkwD
MIVMGTKGDDLIEVRVRTNRNGQVISGMAIVNGRSFSLGRFTDLTIMGLEGNDRIRVFEDGQISTRYAIDGGAGRDTINGVAEPDVVIPTPAPAPTPVPVPTPAPIPRPPSPSWDSGAVEAEIVTRTNFERTTRGLGVLTVNNALTWMALTQAQQMMEQKVCQHTIYGAAYPSFADRLKASKYNYRRAGENIGMGQRDAAAIVLGWMLSPGHRDNMLQPSYNEIGVAALKASDGYTYFAQVLGQKA